ncbi:hypothetical protein O4H50_05785 [Vibrio diazotrophicus]|uniref:hypothetical protein n=1 Tax=Vibrio diazotrophicus TaxID=685 RepID=UPI0022AF31CD|nr:hypothetical protein [Vibrio diazotrophicus]MCZ4371296.1 hypothetical protein [Vibrio diazotrophicus]
MRTLKRITPFALIAIVGGMLVYYFSPPSEKTWGANGEPYMVIAGKKPADASISVRVNYFGRGESCSGWSWNAGSGEVRKGIYNQSFRFEHNFSEDETRYELRVPYKPREPEKNCITTLSDMEVELTNAFDTVGFANLRINKAGKEYYNKPLDVNTIIEAKDCGGKLYKWSKDIWKGIIGCIYVINDNEISKQSETNAESVYFDFSQFNDDTVIHYDILAGENYRSEPLDPTTGK